MEAIAWPSSTRVVPESALIPGKPIDAASRYVFLDCVNKHWQGSKEGQACKSVSIKVETVVPKVSR